MTAVWQGAGVPPQGTRATARDFFSYGFRPFFLGAAVHATLLMCVWLAFVVSTHVGGAGAWLPVAGSPYAWHAHELALGFTTAAIGGFLLTAVPNWTGALPLSGRPLAGLFALWLVGRVAMLFSGFLPAALVAAADLAFVPVLAGVAVLQLLVKPARHNFALVALLAVITAANAAYHLGNSGLVAIDPLAAMRAVVLVVAVMIAMIGGRIIPAFTHNWLNLRPHKGPMPRRNARIDLAAVASVALFAAVEIGSPGSVFSGAAAALAALLNGVRLQGWRGWSARTEPIVWVLHLGYAWLVAGLGLSAVAALTGAVPQSLAYHAFGAGAAATMILAVMSRASLGHTGRKLVAPRPIVAAYVLVTLAALARVVGPILSTGPAMTGVVLALAALAWIAAFALFAIVYAPILTTARVREKLTH